MCGIAGIFEREGGRGREESGIDRVVACMALRGPDGSGVVEIGGGRGWLGHRRLAILDPQGGAQPWVDCQSGLVLSYNGEIYNFKELRRELIGRGHEMTGSCDTEVLARSWLEWGSKCVQRLDGMFAFAVWDPREDSLFLVRDRLGVKPLYFALEEGRLRFASSMRALLAFADLPRRLDGLALRHYLRTIRTTMGERTLVSGISSLEPGTWLRLDGGAWQVERRRYWQLSVLAEADKEPVGLGDAAAMVRALVERATARQLISDVPLGGFLSGGIDSSVLTAAALAAGCADYSAYSIGYARDGFNEWEYVREAVTHHGIGCHEIHLEEGGYLEDWAQLIAVKGEPLSTPNEVPIRHLATAFRERFTVAMSGEGADEVFGGYAGPTFCAWDYDRSLRRPCAAVRAALERGYGRSVFRSRADHFLQVNGWLPAQRIAQLLGDISTEDAVMEWYGQQLGPYAGCATQEAYLALHARVNMEGLLNRLDSSTMAASVEGRVPFTDHALVEAVFRLPMEHKLGLRQPCDHADLNSFEAIEAGLVASKRVLREAFADAVAPRILNRPKMSFPVPFADGFAGAWAQPYRQQLRPGGRLAGCFDAGQLRLLREAALVDPMVAWPLLNLAWWMDAFGIDPPSVSH